ncbi:hypothetical protein Misp01_61630 [Microtetraspora sp. NBRC 13810]|uniref:hypothetical protein n=1 Tax=Microtetraspora sp. NBRC 13810 TaxID=3030990 RepID=UPI0024A2D131|nr:hypothetical protein [Microtetraspora sp. NBRC 13810]GLW11035.1 hypothetical protein Misp01_61630 [Microtetraspora sp. NBRC 13810]
MLLPLQALAGALVAGAVALGLPAHPFGPPSTARIGADGSRVTLSWLAAEDDWVALGQSLGAFEDPTSGPVSTALTGEQKLARSPAVRDYLLSHVTVSQDGRPCPGRLEALERLVAEGARFSFSCPAPVTGVDVTVRALTDLNSAYRTMLTAEGPATPAQSLLTATRHTERVSFSGSGAGVPGSVTVLAAGTGAVAVAGAGVLVALRSRRRAGGRA